MSEANRRDFLKYTAATGMGFWVASRKTLAQEAESKSPNERPNIACVGVNGKGDSDSEQCAEVGNVVAICDTDQSQLDRKANWVRKSDGAKPFANARQFTDFRELFDKMANKFDAITVSIPDHNHAVVAMTGLKHGKAVYCQKPLTHYIGEARALREEAHKRNLATQMGNQGTAENGLREGVEVIRSGAIGAVKEMHVWTNRPIWPQAPSITDRPMNADPIPQNLNWDAWLGPAPYRPYSKVYQPFAWRGWWDWGTGALGDMGCHTANLPFMALKLYEVYPTRVSAESGVINFETYPSWASVTYDFPARGDMPPVKVYWYEGKREVGGGRHVQNVPPRELFHGMEIKSSGSLMVGEKGILYSPDDYGAEYHLLPDSDFKDYKKPEQSLPRNGEGDLGMKKEWMAAMKSGKPETALSNFGYSGKLTEFILLGNVAIRCGAQHPIEWDGENMKVKNWPEANHFLMREYRKGYAELWNA